MMGGDTLEDMIKRCCNDSLEEPTARHRLEKEDAKEKDRLEQIQKVALNTAHDKLAEAYYWAHVAYQRLAYEGIKIPISCTKAFTKFMETADAITRSHLEIEARKENQNRSDVQ